MRLVFDDGHDSGLYSWDVLEDLGANQAQNWERYLARLAEHGLTRDEAYMLCSLSADLRVTQVVDATKGVHIMLAKSVFAGARQ